VTVDDLPAAFATLPQPWRDVLEGWTPEAEQALIDAVRRVSGNQPLGPSDPFRALRMVAPTACKVLIVGQDPYPTPGQADGLSFSAGRAAPRPSLRRIFDVLATDRPAWKRPISGRLDAWASQGALLLNTALTVELGRAGSHLDVGWHALTCAIVKAAIGVNPDLAIMAWGRRAVDFAEAALAAAGAVGRSVRVLKARHPSNDYRREFMADGSHFALTSELVDWWRL
jgi:uracil-DNA glycosylase